MLLAVAVAGVSTAAPLIREAAVPALAVAFWRNALAAGVLAGGAAFGGADGRRLSRRDAALTAAAGTLLALHFAAWIPSLSYTTVASSVALVATQPVWAALLAVGLGRPVPRRTWAGIALALAGAVAVAGVDVTVSVRALAGDALALVGGVLAAAYVTVGAEVRRRVSTTAYTLRCYGVAAVVLLVACAVARRPVWGYSSRAWLCIVALAVGAQLIGHSLVNKVLATIPATAVSVAILGEVVGASALAAWWFGERPPAALVPAAVAILVGVTIVVRAPAVASGDLVA